MWWVWAIALASPGIKTAEGDPSTGSLVDVPEYQRLTQELEALATRNAWAGVERTFQELVATGVSPSLSDWLRGAESARWTGDIGAVYDRLMKARSLDPDNRMVVEWLYDIDHRFGRVVLACDLGSLVQLECASMPFDPEAQRAIRFAQTQIREKCRFDGRLPAGEYQFLDHRVQVVPQVQGVVLDLQGRELSRAERRQLKEAWDARSDEDVAP